MAELSNALNILLALTLSFPNTYTSSSSRIIPLLYKVSVTASMAELSNALNSSFAICSHSPSISWDSHSL